MQETRLTDRREKVLRILIQEYVHSAQPVSSKTIAENHALGVSAATIRNDMASLEQSGLLTQPHTSAGRIPTRQGYRYYVKYLLSDVELPPAERRLIRSRFNLVKSELDQWLRISTSVLAHASQSLALATPPQAAFCSFKHVELVGIHETKVLLVLVLQTGIVKQQLLDLETPKNQSTLSTISNELNDHLSGLTVSHVMRVMSSLSDFAQEVSLLIIELMNRVDDRATGQIYRDGLAHVLAAPEFSEGENIRRIVQVIEERTLLEKLVNEYNGGDGIQVIIAGNDRYVELQSISVIMSPYGVSDLATGMLGVVGPIRMSYSRTIGAVRYVATLMSDIVEEMYSN
ncbi:MAG: heat-inducible transcriptional repressor HrcA [Chloroflexota bacterium]